jgi:mannitol-1-phosphate 5-dehydrogenase
VKTAIQFGAGNIGRGFMGQLFREAGLRTAFVDTDARLVELINQRGCYTLKLLDAYTVTEKDLLIDEVEAVHAADIAGVARRFSAAEAAGTAVGVKSLPAIAVLIAAGIEERRRAAPRPIDIYLCENSLDAAVSLRQAVLSLLDGDTRTWAERNVGFVGTSVARMVPPPGRFAGEDPLLVVADAFHELPYDATAARASALAVPGIRGVRNFAAEVERKLFTHNLGHAALGYLGRLKGCTYVHEPFGDPELSAVFDGALDETSKALLAKHAGVLDPAEHAAVRRDVRVRFGNPLLGDTVQRVARDPIRKLGPTDRLAGSIRLCVSQGTFPARVCRVCAAAFLYDAPDDPDAVRLQALLAEKGIEETLRAVSGIDPGSPEGREIVRGYRELSARRR